MKNKLKAIFLLFISLLLISCDVSKTDNLSNKSDIINDSKVSKTTEIEILGMGDLIFHQPIIKNYNENGTYDFSPIFSNVYEDINSADLTIANFEGTTNLNRELSGFPLFNFPKESINSLKNVGFDAMSTANNHALDTGIEGLIDTINNMKDNNIRYFGTNLNDSSKGKIIDVKGIKVGLISFTDTLNGMDSIISGKEYFVNTFSQDVKRDIQELKENSDVVIVYPHWGIEYQHEPSERQIYLKDKLFEYGADIILGSHPHVLQRYENIESSGESKFIIYSMGNFLSNQRQEFIHREGVETGCMVKITLLKINDKTEVKNVNVIPTFVNRYWENNKLTYNIIKLEDFKSGGKLENTVDLKSKKFFLQKLEDANYVLTGVKDE